MKKDIERLLVFLVPVIFVEKIVRVYAQDFLLSIMRANYSSLKPLGNLDTTIGGLLSLMNLVNVLIPLMPAAVIAVWVWRLEKKDRGRPILWALGALLLHYWLLLLYIGQKLHVANERSPDAAQPNSVVNAP